MRASLLTRAAFVLDYAWACDMDPSADWLKQAEQDLAAAEVSASAGHHNWAAFQSLRAGERASRALAETLEFTLKRQSVTGTLQGLCTKVAVPEYVLDAARELDKVYITSRYPDAFASGCPADFFTARNSRELIDQGRQVLEFCRGQIH